MKTPAPPPAPDPVATAKAQAEMNKETAITQQQVNMVDQTNPYGSLTYSQTGKWDDGTPKYSSSVTLSPEEQKKQELQWAYDQIVGQTGVDQAGRISKLLSEPVNLNNDAVENRLMELGSKRLNPELDRQRESLASRLANQGVYEGSEAYNNAMTRFGQQENDARNQLLLSGRQQAINEILTERNQPINETTALMSGAQVNQPQFGNTPTAQVSSPDLAGMTYQSYQMGPYAQYQAQQQQKNAMMGGLFGLGGAAAGGWAMGGFKGLK